MLKEIQYNVVSCTGTHTQERQLIKDHKQFCLNVKHLKLNSGPTRLLKSTSGGLYKNCFCVNANCDHHIKHSDKIILKRRKRNYIHCDSSNIHVVGVTESRY